MQEIMAGIQRLMVKSAKKGSPQTEGFVKEYLEKMEGSEWKIFSFKTLFWGSTKKTTWVLKLNYLVI